LEDYFPGSNRYRSNVRTNDLERDKEALLGQLPVDGGTIANPALQARLGWDTERYFAARNALVDEGLVVRGRGRGGTVRRVLSDQADTVSVTVEPGADATATVEAALQSELSLYQPMREVIGGDWAKDHRAEPLAVEITALQGRRATGGIWSRPDIVSVEVRTFEYVPGKHLEIWTFEVKAANAISVQAVYEALAHRRAASRSYVIFHVPAEQASSLEEIVVAVAELARDHGIGVVTAEDPADYGTWVERVEARRIEPDPERLNEFISTQLSSRTKRRIAQRLR